MSALLESYKKTYAYQAEVKNNPIIQAWLTRVEAAVAAMQDVKVEFATTLQSRCKEHDVYFNHNNQNVVAFLAPVLTSTEAEDGMDEECLPYYRVRFADGVEIIADDAELFSFDQRLGELITAVSGAFACARNMDFVGPWDLVAHGTEEDQANFLKAYNAQKFSVPFEFWQDLHNTPEKYRAAAKNRPAMA